MKNYHKVIKGGGCVFATILGLGLGLGLALPVQADDSEVPLADFIAACSGLGGLVVPAGVEYEVAAGLPDAAVNGDCIVTLNGGDSELEFAENLSLIVKGDFIITGSGDDAEVQLGKNGTLDVEADFVVDLPGSDSEIQFEENTCLKVAGNLTLTAGSPLGDDDSEVQIKKVEEGVSPCNDRFNIKVGGNIVMAAHGEGDGSADRGKQPGVRSW